MKTCWEVFQYMNCSESKLSCQAGDGANSLIEGYSKVDLNQTMLSDLLCLCICLRILPALTSDSIFVLG